MNVVRAEIVEHDGREYLRVEVPIQDPPRPSKSGRTLIVATTNGNRPSSVEVIGREVIVGLNAYVKEY